MEYIKHINYKDIEREEIEMKKASQLAAGLLGVVGAFAATDAAARCGTVTVNPNDGHQWTASEFQKSVEKATRNEVGRYDEARGVAWSFDSDDSLFGNGPIEPYLMSKWAKKPDKSKGELSIEEGCSAQHRAAVEAANIGDKVISTAACTDHSKGYKTVDSSTVETLVKGGRFTYLPELACGKK